MNFAFSEDQEALRDQVRRFFTDRCPLSVVRNIFEGEDLLDRSLYAEMAAMGLLGAAIPESYGGSGLGPLELCVVAEEAGRVMAPVPLLSSIYLAAEVVMDAGTEAQKRDWLPRLANGTAIGTFAHAERVGPVSERTVTCEVVDGKMSGVKTPVAYGAVADMAIVSAREGGLVRLWLVDLHDPSIIREPLSSIDPTAPQARLRFEGTPAQALPGSDWSAIELALDRGAVLLAFEQVGGADRTLEAARDFALQRMAFGRQIGSFQAVKHMLADMYVAATLARSNSYYGAWALSREQAQLPAAAATARVSATEAFLLCAKDSIQVHGGVGFTWEAENHLYYRRANGLALALGPQSAWEDRLIGALCQSDSVRAAA